MPAVLPFLPAIASIGGSLIAGNQAKQGQKKAAQQALTGYNYLTDGPGKATITQAQNAGNAASAAQAGTQATEGGVLNTQGQLLGTAPATPGTQTAFDNYLNSTGYKFQLGQGTQAIEGSAAAKGILNSGDTAKALTQYGQGLAAQNFNNYLGQLGSLAGQYGNLSNQQGSTAALGVSAASAAGNAGTAGGGNAANQTAAGNQGLVSGISGAAGGISSALTNSKIQNWFGML